LLVTLRKALRYDGESRCGWLYENPESPTNTLKNAKNTTENQKNTKTEV